MQKLLVLQSLWSMQNLRDAAVASTLQEQIGRIEAAGFAGIGAMWEDDGLARETLDIASGAGLVVEGTCVPSSLDDLEAVLARAERYQPHHLNIQLKILPQGIDEASRILETAHSLAVASSVPVYFETHRGRITNDLLVMMELLDRLPDLQLLVDLSHYVVAREIELPVEETMQAQITAILNRACAFHGRVAGSGQVQLPLSFEQHRPWIDQFSAWWSEGFASWRRRSGPDAELTFVCELGPQPYAISGVDGRDLSDRWMESLTLMEIAQAAWDATTNADRR